jgi:anti-sigma regulatory factor (Ser/Thr protein kinase)
MKPPSSVELVLDSQIDEIRRLGPWLERVLPSDHLDMPRAEIELALVELVSNIIRHGYVDRARGPIHLRLERRCARARIEIHDGGRPVPPWAVENADDALAFDPDDLDKLPVGGIGLAMSIAVMDHFDYAQGCAGNVTTIEKALAAPTG